MNTKAFDLKIHLVKEMCSFLVVTWIVKEPVINYREGGGAQNSGGGGGGGGSSQVSPLQKIRGGLGVADKVLR